MLSCTGWRCENYGYYNMNTIQAKHKNDAVLRL